ncbi:MAG: NUDIX hydrolase [Dehalococcoidia bacterium]|nr:NUDIX hydrolase [Dehalococcoidia bacterium]
MLASSNICVAGILAKDGNVLLVYRAPWLRFFPKAWDLFGGHVNDGESLEDALRREATEELGIKVLDCVWLEQIADPIEPATIHVYAVRVWEGEPTNMAPEEHTEVRWFNAPELPESEALDAYRPLLMAYLS